jgi:hypothetical protein
VYAAVRGVAMIPESSTLNTVLQGGAFAVMAYVALWMTWFLPKLLSDGAREREKAREVQIEADRVENAQQADTDRVENAKMREIISQAGMMIEKKLDVVLTELRDHEHRFEALTREFYDHRLSTETERRGPDRRRNTSVHPKPADAGGQ